MKKQPFTLTMIGVLETVLEGVTVLWLASVERQKSLRICSDPIWVLGAVKTEEGSTLRKKDKFG